MNYLKPGSLRRLSRELYPLILSTTVVLLQWLKPESVEVDIVRAEEPEGAGIEESELNEMWGYVGKKSNPIWN